MIRIVGGIYRQREITPPPFEEVRPTQDILRKAIFSALGEHLDGKTVLDLFAGSGAFGFESLSRGALKAVFAEKNPKCLQAIEATGKRFNCLDKMELCPGDALSTLGKLGGQKRHFDYIFLDPPYAMKVFADVILSVGKNHLLSDSGIIVLEQDELPQPVEGYALKTYKYSYKQVGIYRKVS